MHASEPPSDPLSAVQVSLSSEELNFLIMQYLRENHFLHTSFSFGHECHAQNAQHEMWRKRVGAGALISVVQKGLQYMAIESTIDEQGNEVLPNESFTLFGSSDRLVEDEDDDLSMHSAENGMKTNGVDQDQRASKRRRRSNDDDDFNTTKKENSESQRLPRDINSDSIKMLAADVSGFTCSSWNPTNDHLLVCGTKDGKALEWRNVDTASSPLTLAHMPSSSQVRDIICASWNSSGNLLATGGFDGQCRIWTLEGELSHVLSLHRTALLTIEWNRKGDLLLTISADGDIIVWESDSGEVRHVFSSKSRNGTNADWIDESTFVTCGADGCIEVWSFGEKEPARKLIGHDSDVSCVRYNNSCHLLASAAKEGAKVWDLESSSAKHSLQGHDGCVVGLLWQPGTTSILATYSLDSTIKFWDALEGICLRSISCDSAVFNAAFSADGLLLAVGTNSGSVHVWQSNSKRKVRSFAADETYGATSDIQFGPTKTLAVIWSNRGLGIIQA